MSAAEAVKLVTRLAMLLAVNGEAVKAETVVNDAINKYESSAESGLPLRAIIIKETAVHVTAIQI